MVFGEACYTGQIVNSRLRLLQRVRVDVRRVDERAREQPFFPQQDSQRIDLFARAAAGDPDLERRVGAKDRHHAARAASGNRRVAEHLAHRHGEEVQELREHCRVAQHFVLELGQSGAVEVRQRSRQAPLQRRARVLPEVVVVLQVDRFDQERQLDVEILRALEVTALSRHPHAHQREELLDVRGLAM